MTTDQKKRREQGQRLRAARIEAGYKSSRTAALENGWKESSYSAHERGTRTIGQDDAERYAKRLRLRGAKVTPQLILFGAELHPPTPDVSGITEEQGHVVRLVFQAFLEWAMSADEIRDKMQDPAYQAGIARVAAQYAQSRTIHEAARRGDEAALDLVRLALEMKHEQ